MKLENGIEKLAEILGLEMGQEFIVDGASHPDIPLYNPYKITTAGIFDKQGVVIMSYVLAPILYGQLAYTPIVKSLLTDDEKEFLKINLKHLPFKATRVCFHGDTIKTCKYAVMHNIFTDPLMGTIDRTPYVALEFARCELNREYTLAELGLED